MKKLEIFVLSLILILSAFLRLHRIEDFMVFLGDEGRDALVVKRMIVDKKFTLLGPQASVGGMFLGPIYYYFMAPFLWAFRLNPVGPAVMVALFGIATVFLIWWVGREFFGSFGGLVSSLLYAVSPVVIIYSRSSWNPNILPFFSLLTIYFLTKSFSNKRFLFLTGASLGIALQLHYLASFLFFIIFATLLLFEKRKISHWSLIISHCLLGFLLTFSPFILFELRHHFPNTRALVQFLTAGKEVSFKGSRFFPIVSSVFFRLFETVVCNHNLFLTSFLFFFLFLAFFLHQKTSRQQSILFLWIALGSLLFGFYQKEIYDYYLGFLFPAPFLLIGFAFECLRKNKVLFFPFLGLILLILFFNFKNSPAFGIANRQLYWTRENVKLILEKTEGKPFNFALLSGGNSDHAYRYFMEIWGRKPVKLTHDPKSITDQLFVLCETKECHPLGHPLWEIAGFGRAEIAGKWKTPDGKTIFKLVHYKGD